MNTRQENIFSMYVGFVEYMNQQSETTSQIPFFSETFSQFKEGYEAIQRLRVVQEADVTGATVDKSNLREELEAMTLSMSKKLVALAEVKKNYSLLKKAAYTPSDLARATDVVIKDIAELILGLGTEYMSDLVVYEVTSSRLADFKLKIEDYVLSLIRPKQHVNNRASATEQIEQLFELSGDRLDLMDTLTEAVAEKFPEFYDGYLRVRHVIKAGNRSLALRANAKDMSGQPLANVSFEIVASSLAQARVEGEKVPMAVTYLFKKTTEKGNLQVQHLPEGTYSAIAKKLGYQDKEVIFHVVGGEMVDLEVTMEQASV